MVRILAPLDGSALSERAVTVGEQIAETLGGRLELLSVVDDPVILDLAPGLVQPDRGAVERYLERLAQTLPASVPTTTTVVLGSPVDQILAAADAVPDTIIVMSTHGRSGIGRVMFGSVADKVTRGASCPLVLIRGTAPDATVRPGTVLVTLDGSPRAETALSLAVQFARGMGSEVRLLRVIPPFWTGPAVHYGPEVIYLSGDQVAELTEQALTEVHGYLDEVASRLRRDEVRVSWEARIGRPADEIVQAAETIDPALIVMSSHGRGGFRRWALGSVADEVLHRVSTPVVIIPDRQAAATAQSEQVALAGD